MSCKKSQWYRRPQIIPFNLEAQLAEYLRTLQKWGFGLCRLEVLELIRDFVIANDIKTNFKYNQPGKDWFLLFKKIYKLIIKKPQSEGYARKSTDPFLTYEYFKLDD